MPQLARPRLSARSRTVRAEFEAATLPHLDTLYGLGLRLSRNPADSEDLVQETLVRAYAAWERFDDRGCCKAWLCRILTNTYISKYRRGRTQRRFATEQGEQVKPVLFGEARTWEAEHPEETIVDNQLADEVKRALSALGEEHRDVVVLADLEGWKYREVADALGVPVGTVMSRLFRARRLLEGALRQFAATEYGFVKAAA